MKKTILVIEDDVKHLDDAKKFFADKDVEVVFARTLAEANTYLPPSKVEIAGVISDIYFPLTYDHSTWSNPEPIGVRVGIVCRDHNIPCVLNTAGYHHGDRYEWIYQMSSAVEGFPPMVDASSDYHKEAQTKDWEEALGTLLLLIKKS